MIPLRLFAVVFALIPVAALAGRYPASGTQSFSFANGTMDLGDSTAINSSTNAPDGFPSASVVSSALRLTAASTGNTLSSFKLPDLDPGRSLDSFDVTMKVRMTASGTPADGWSLNIGAIPAGNGSGEGGFVMTGGLVIAFDTYDNGSDPPSIEVFSNGISVGNFPQTFSFNPTFRSFAAHWDASGLDLTYTVAATPVAICTNLPTPGFNPVAGNSFAFSGRTGGATQDTYFDDLLITTTLLTPLETGGPVISEFMAENGGGLEDENGESSDWIEIYNGQSTAKNLSGWSLTDLATNKTKWPFPSVSIPPYGYLTIFASGLNRVNPANPLHTNFTLPKSGGYLALVKSDGATLASEFNYGAQAQDVSYGLLPNGASFTYGYLETATPGGRNTGLQAAGPPAEDVVFLKAGQPTTGGLFSTDFSLAIQAPLAAGSVVRYTLNNTIPSAGSTAYSGPVAISASTTVRARVFTPNQLPGPVGSRTFLKLDSSLTSYHGSGQAFSSNLPIVVMDSFGVPVDAYTDAGQARPYRLTYAVVIDKNPLASAPLTNRALITDTPDFQGRSGTHVRGESSAGFPQHSYAWELWNNDDQDKDASVLGFPAESDWVLHAPYTDKTLMRNYLCYDRLRALDGQGSAMGVKFVEVFFNQDGGSLSASDYRGVFVLVEKIKRNKNRVDIEKLTPLMTDPALVSGGYVFKKDKPGIGNVSLNTTTQSFQFVEPETPNSTQQAWLTSYLNTFETALAGANFANPTTGYAAYIDPLSFVDNQWMVEIAKQIDGYRLSTYFTKDRNNKVRSLPIWDYNLSLYNADYATGDTATGWYYSSADAYYWTRLRQDPNYMILNWDRYWELRRGLFDTTTILNYIDGLASQLVNGSSTVVTNSMPNLAPLAENPAMRHYRAWPILGSYVWPNPGNVANRTKFWTGPTQHPTGYTTADGEVDAMKDFLKQRLGWIDDQNFVGSVIYRPPNFSSMGGNVSNPTTLTITPYAGTAPAGYSYATGTIYYTTNGSDPRNSSGGIAGSAYSSPLSLTTSVTVKARLKNGSNWSPLTSANFVVGAAPASAANLVISELCYKPTPPAPGSPEYTAGYTAGNNFEYVELLNVSPGTVDLTNCQFTGGITFNFAAVAPSKLTLASGGRVLVVENQAAFLLRYGSALASQVLGEFTGNLSNSGETITLLAANTSVIATVTYGTDEPWPLAAQESGYSLVLNNPAGSPTYTAADWRASAQPGGTPGAAAGPAFTGSPTGDTDNDGLKDLMEFATGSSWTNSGSASRPVASWQTFVVGSVSNTYLTFSYRRNNAADGVHFLVQLSTALTGWSTDASAVTYAGTTNNGDGTSTVVWRATQPVTASTRQFMRLNVTP